MASSTGFTSRVAVSRADVERAADALLLAGVRPSVERVRQHLGRGSPNTINPLLDAWWKALAGRLDGGHATAFHRLPPAVAHVAEALWLQALAEARTRAERELGRERKSIEDQTRGIEVTSHVLTLREAELDARLRDRDALVKSLQAQIRSLTTLLEQERAAAKHRAARATSPTRARAARRSPAGAKGRRAKPASPSSRKKRTSSRRATMRPVEPRSGSPRERNHR